MKEEWKQVIGYAPYEVSNLGRVRRNGHVLVPGKNNSGYLCVMLYLDRNRKNKLVHRLVAEAFIPNPMGFPIINHKDENPSNNVVDNLEWCSVKYNNNYGTRNARMARTKSKPVQQLDEDGNVLKEWPSASAAEKVLGIAQYNISSVCHRQRKRAGGFRWRFKLNV